MADPRRPAVEAVLRQLRGPAELRPRSEREQSDE